MDCESIDLCGNFRGIEPLHCPSYPSLPWNGRVSRRISMTDSSESTNPPDIPDFRDDYDNPWKTILEAYFPEFMAFFFPTIAAQFHQPVAVGSTPRKLRRCCR